ncbi:MAG: HipA domain-containing protein [Coriobacteriaceae bacterium]
MKQFVLQRCGESTLDGTRNLPVRLRTSCACCATTQLTDVAETISMFWEMFIVDALLGNFDRHGMNWGFIKRDNAYALAPVFDNRSCLFPI